APPERVGSALRRRRAGGRRLCEPGRRPLEHRPRTRRGPPERRRGRPAPGQGSREGELRALRRRRAGIGDAPPPPGRGSADGLRRTAVNTWDGRATAPASAWWRAEPQDAAGATPLSGEGALPFAALLAFTFVLFLAPQNVFPALAQMRVALFF